MSAVPVPDDLEPVIRENQREREAHDLHEACRDDGHRYWQDGADGQGGIAGRCYCGDKTDYPVGGAA